MFANEVIQEESLPSPEERREILERARRVLIEARFVADQLDRLQAELGGELPGKTYPRLQTPETLRSPSLAILRQTQLGLGQPVRVQV